MQRSEKPTGEKDLQAFCRKYESITEASRTLLGVVAAAISKRDVTVLAILAIVVAGFSAFSYLGSTWYVYATTALLSLCLAFVVTYRRENEHGRIEEQSPPESGADAKGSERPGTSPKE